MMGTGVGNSSHPKDSASTRMILFSIGGWYVPVRTYVLVPVPDIDGELSIIVDSGHISPMVQKISVVYKLNIFNDAVMASAWPSSAHGTKPEQTFQPASHWGTECPPAGYPACTLCSDF